VPGEMLGQRQLEEVERHVDMIRPAIPSKPYFKTYTSQHENKVGLQQNFSRINGRIPNISKQLKKNAATHVFNFSSLFKMTISPHVLKAALNSVFFASFMKIHEIKIPSQAFVCRHFLRRS
jgi:hypothetical protein